MRVLLINSNLKSDILAAPPLGISYVASAAEAAGHEVRVLDLCFRRNVLQDVETALREFSPQVVGVSIRNIDNVNMLHPVSYIPEVARIIDHIRRITDIPIILGGSGASLCPGRILERLNADYVIASEGESSFAALLRSLENGGRPRDIPGLGMMVHGRFSLNPPILQDFITKDAGLGRWIDMGPYMRMGGSYNIQSKRGCVLRCIYCTYNQVLEGNRLRLRPPVDVVDEIEEALQKYHPKCFEFVDSVFNLPRDHCVEILEEIARRPWKARFTAMGVSPLGLTPAFLRLMKRVGFSSFMITPESASPSMIRVYRKGFSLDDLVHAAEAVHKTQFTVMWFFLVGGPGETNITLDETIAFNLKHIKLTRRPPYNISNFYLGVRLYPGTRMWDIALEEGYIHEDSDPLEQLWYVSEGLDLEMAVSRMVEAARVCPEISLGFDERFLFLSNVLSMAGDLLKMAKPYWRHIWGLNQLLIRTGLRYPSRPSGVVPRIRRYLRAQGYQGRLLG